MLVRFWGVRGSTPTPQTENMGYGGNTSCIEVRTDSNQILVFDGGTGIRLLGNGLEQEFAGTPINASGVLLDGTKVDGPAALRRALVAQQEQFVRTVSDKLLTYAIGRGLEHYDAPAIRGVVRAAAADNYSWSSTILALVKSAPFRMRRAGS